MSLDQDKVEIKPRSSDCGICKLDSTVAEIKTLQPTISHGAAIMAKFRHNYFHPLKLVFIG